MSEALEWWITLFLLLLACVGIGAILGAIQARSVDSDDSRAERPWPIWPH